MLKNNFFTIIIAIFLSLPTYAEESSMILPSNEINKIEDVNLNNQNVDNNTSLNYKKPTSKRKIAKKFLLAMSGVGISSVLLFVILSLYNRIRNNLNINNEYFEENTNLKTPENQQEAIKTFLEKTKWDI